MAEFGYLTCDNRIRLPFFRKGEADIVKQLKPDIQARPSPHTGSKGFVCPSKKNFIICKGEQSAKGLDLSIYNHPRFPHNGPEYIFDWLCMRGTDPSVVPDMCNPDLGWTLKQEEEFNSAARLEGG